MRIIPKKTKVRLEFFKGIGIIDMVVALVGAALAIAVLLSDLPAHTVIAIIIAVIVFGLVIPIEDDRGYIMVYHAILFLARHRSYEKKYENPEIKKSNKIQKNIKLDYEKTNRKRPENLEENSENEEAVVEQDESEIGTFEKNGQKDKNTNNDSTLKRYIDRIIGKNEVRPTVYDITPFTGIKDEFIEYGGKYYGIVVEIPPVEFRFYTEERQNNVIDRCYGSVLRTVVGSDSAAMVKIDRPIIYDSYIKNEEKKLADIKEAYLNGLLNESELTKRVGIIQDRIEQIKEFNKKDKVYDCFHYIVFFGKDKKALKGQARDMVLSMKPADMNCRILDEKELVIFLKYSYGYKFDEREAYKLNPDEYLDWILPEKIEMSSRVVKYDGLITHTLRVKDYPTVVSNAWGHTLFNTMGTRCVLKMRPVDRFKSIKQIDRALEEIRSQFNDTGKVSKSMELETHFETLTRVLSMLQGDNETLFDVNVFVTIYDYEQTKKEDEARNHIKREDDGYSIPLKKQIKRKLAEESFKTTDLFMQQFEGYASSAVSAFDGFRSESRGIHSSSVAASFPYVYKTLNDKNGICIGESGGLPVFINFFKRDKDRVNSNVVIIGKSGSGKSYATKTMLANLAAENSKIFILDPENEYYEMANNFDGKIIDVGSATQGRLNPFQIISSLSDEEGDDGDEGDVSSSYNVHLQFLEEFFQQILPEMNADAREYLNNIIVRVYDEKGIDEYTDLSQLTPEDYPTFDDLYEKILNDYQYSTGDYSKNNLRTLLNYVSKFSSGGRNSLLWNGPASVNTDENFIVFNFQSLLANKNNTIANAQMLLVLKYLDNEVIKNRDYNIKYGAQRRIIVVIDEAHVFIDPKFPIALDFMFQLAKRIRKYNGMQIVITQNIKDFVGTEELARKSTAIINASQYSFIFPLAPNDMHDLCKLYEKAGAINESEQDDIINNGRGRAFVVTSPSERTNVSIVAPEGIERIFTV